MFSKVTPLYYLRKFSHSDYDRLKSRRRIVMDFELRSGSGMPDITLKQAQQAVDAWIQQVGVRYFSELTNLAQLVEEVGELARIMSRQYGDQSWKEGESDLNLSGELADVLFVLICIANQTGVDLTEAFEKNLQKNTRRDLQRHRDNPRLHPN
jgi:NTP pyrophosphatase (non-canonical NTP hydrolase)